MAKYINPFKKDKYKNPFESDLIDQSNEIDESQKIRDSLKQANRDESISNLKAFGRGLGQSVFSAGDEAVALAQTGGEALKDISGGKLPELKQLLDKYSKYQSQEQKEVERAYDERAPYAWGGELTGTFLPAVGLPSKLSKANKALKALDRIQNINPTQSGMVQGAFGSKSNLTEDPSQVAEDIVEGGAIGGAVGGAGKILSKAAGAKEKLLPLAGQVLLDFDPDTTRKLMEKGPKYLDDVTSNEELTRSLMENVFPAISDKLVTGSKKSVEAINKLPNFKDTEISNILIPLRNSLSEELGGRFKDQPARTQALRYLDDIIGDWSKGEEVKPERVKRLIQGIQSEIDFPQRSGDIVKPDSNVLIKSQKAIKDYVEKLSPEFKDIMEETADFARTKSQVDKLGKTENRIRNTAKKVGSKKEGYVIPSEVLKKVEEMFTPEELEGFGFKGGSIIENLEKANLNDVINKDLTRGSKQVRKWIEFTNKLPGGRFLGPALGTLADRYGGKIVLNTIKKIASDVDDPIKMQKKLDNNKFSPTETIIIRNIISSLNQNEEESL